MNPKTGSQRSCPSALAVLIFAEMMHQCEEGWSGRMHERVVHNCPEPNEHGRGTEPASPSYRLDEQPCYRKGGLASRTWHESVYHRLEEPVYCTAAQSVSCTWPSAHHTHEACHYKVSINKISIKN
jgi:hypothetical protein